METLERDYARVTVLPAAATALALVPARVDDHDWPAPIGWSGVNVSA
jgi:hypothetical protein